jgi:hypothetical protein
MASKATPSTANPKVKELYATKQHNHLLTIHAQRMGTSNIPIHLILMEISGQIVVGFCLILALAEV